MASYEELIETERRLREVLARGAEAQLRAVPGVVGVSVGLKQRGGAVTDQHAIRVYVREKLPLDQVPRAQQIPAEIDGVPTDVNVLPAVGFHIDETRYRPILGGIEVTNRIIVTSPDNPGHTEEEDGTLGCIATFNSDKSAVILSNWHVLAAHNALLGDRIYQPAPGALPPVLASELPKRPDDANDAIGRLLGATVNRVVDAAIARIDKSSCCNCCGIDHKNEINGLSVGGKPPSNGIVGQRAAVSGATVFKVGVASGRTVGKVVDVSHPTVTVHELGQDFDFDGQIQIASTDPATPFSRKGDSGSVIIDDQGFIVGLLFAGNGVNPPGDITMANHIEDVCAQLHITINFASTSHSAGARVAVPSAPLAPPGLGQEVYRAARRRLQGDPAGRWLLAAAELWGAELVALINGRRPVTVAWHRAHGPAFLAAALNELRAGGEALPAPVEGTPLEEALERLRVALLRHGSPELRREVEKHGPAVMAAARGSATLTDVLVKLTAAGLVLPDVAAPAIAAAGAV